MTFQQVLLYLQLDPKQVFQEWGKGPWAQVVTGTTLSPRGARAPSPTLPQALGRAASVHSLW